MATPLNGVEQNLERYVAQPKTVAGGNPANPSDWQAGHATPQPLVSTLTTVLSLLALIQDNTVDTATAKIRTEMTALLQQAARGVRLVADALATATSLDAALTAARPQVQALGDYGALLGNAWTTGSDFFTEVQGIAGGV